MKNYLYIFWNTSLRGGYICFHTIRGIYLGAMAQRSVAKMLKGGYYVIFDDKKHELARGDLKVGFFKVEALPEAEIKQKEKAVRIEFFSVNRNLVYRTEI